MKFNASDLVGDVAGVHPGTIRVFQEHGIDFCCAGRKPLGEACREHSLEVGQLLRELEERTAAPALRAHRDWNEAPIPDLIEYVLRRYHDPLQSELPRLTGILVRVNEAHGDRMPRVLRPLEGLFRELVHDLEPHLMQEERVLFPMILDLLHAKAPAHLSWFHCGSIGNAISVMERGHEIVGSLLARMREVTNGYEVPSWACASVRELYTGLCTLQQELEAHLHLEAQFLYPRARRLELECGLP